MSEQIAVEAWEGQRTHVDSTIQQDDFLDASRALVYAATRKPGNTFALNTFRKVGLVQSAGFSERKELSQIFELGSNVAYMVPGRTTGAISIARILLSGKDMLNALYHAEEDITDDEFIRSLADINTPLYLMFSVVGASNQGSTSAAKYSRVFANCHITSRQESIGAGQRIIVENASIQYAEILEAKFSRA